MLTERKSPDRRKLLIWSAALLSGLSLFRWRMPKEKQTETVKMLTRDGKLVEIDKTLLQGKKVKINDKELLSWVNKKK
jgi:hypothetical protein